MLFLGKSVLLTPMPVDINGTYELSLTKPLNVVTSGAYVSIDVTAMLAQKFKREIDLSVLEAKFYALVPRESIEASLIAKNGEVSKFTHISFGQSDDADYLILSRQGGLSTDKKFVKMVITSKAPLKGVQIEWSNYRP